LRLTENLNDALNQQVLHEYRNMLVYKQIEGYFEDLQLKNLANYFKDQAQHEKEHGDKFVQYIQNRTGGKLSLAEVDFPNLVLGEISAIADAYVALEEQTTESIEEIYDLALSEKSYMDLGFLEEMLNEQVEEEDSAQEFTGKIKLVKDLVLFDATFGD